MLSDKQLGDDLDNRSHEILSISNHRQHEEQRKYRKKEHPPGYKQMCPDRFCEVAVNEGREEEQKQTCHAADTEGEDYDAKEPEDLDFGIDGPNRRLLPRLEER